MNSKHCLTWVVFLTLFLPVPSIGQGSHPPFPAAAPGSQGIAGEALHELAALVRDFVEDQRIVGAELLIIKNRRTVFHEAFGWQDYQGDAKIPMEINTIFNLRSMTKAVVGTAVQMLIDDGKVALEDRVAAYIPSFEKEACRAITVEHLLTHRSGLPLGPLMFSFSECGDLFEVADRAAKHGPEFEPGTAFQYSDPGADTLGAVLARASGCDVDVFLQERILGPLAMNDTVTLVKKDDPRTERIASLFAGKRGAWMRIWTPRGQPLYPFALGSQSLYGTAMDYARFLALWMDRGVSNGKRLLSEEGIHRGLTPVTDMDYPTGFAGLDVWYGQMWMQYTREGIGAAPEIFGHSGSDGTIAWACPGRDLMILYFTQSRGQDTVLEFEAAISRLLLLPQKEPGELQCLEGEDLPKENQGDGANEGGVENNGDLENQKDLENEVDMDDVDEDPSKKIQAIKMVTLLIGIVVLGLALFVFRMRR